MTEFGAKGKKLLQELKRSDWLPPYNEEGVRAVQQEISALEQEINDTLASKREDEELPIQVKIGLAVHHAALLRNKRCLLAYVRFRADKVTQLRWETGPVIPDLLRSNLSSIEQDFFNKYDRLLTDYQQDFGLDLTGDLTPPKELYIEVRALIDCGEIFTDSGLVRLEKGTRHHLRRSDVDHLIRQGKLEHLDNDTAA
jgi:GINS complex subunit 1